MDLKWIEGFMISVKNDKNVIISANKEGLLTLADQLISLAKEESGTHIHYDEYNSLEDGSSEMIIEKYSRNNQLCYVCHAILSR